jgi:hypothetical protein
MNWLQWMEYPRSVCRTGLFLAGMAVMLSATPRGQAAPSPLAWERGDGFRSAPLAPAGDHKAGFALLPSAQTGITFSNQIAVERYTTNQIYLNGSGVAAGDVDGDGWCDLFFAGLSGASRLYHNEGAFHFRDVTREAGLDGVPSDATGAVFADLDGDGDLDLVVNSVGQGSVCFLNDGRGRFSVGARLNPARCGASVALADIDGDGDLDLYVANYRLSTVRDDPGARYRLGTENGRQVVLEYNGRSTRDPALEGRFVLGETGRIIEKGEVDVLYRNDGGGRFTLIPFESGAFLDEEGRPLQAAPHDWGLSVLLRDLNGDGLPDIYVCNDFESPDRFWLNVGGGRFRAAPSIAVRHTGLFSMGADVADFDRDGKDDLFIVDMLGRGHVSRHLQIGGVPPYEAPVGPGLDRTQYSQNVLLKGRGDGTFVDVAFAAGVEASGWSWTPAFLDVDLDGYEDLLITAGHQRDAMNADVIDRAGRVVAGGSASHREMLELNNQFARLATPHVAFHNRGDGTFEETAAEWGFGTTAVSQGMCLADLDNDGDLDVIVNSLNGPAEIYRNEGGAPRVAVQLHGTGGNTAGIGSRILVRDGAIPHQSQEIMAGGRYLSCDQTRRTFAAGSRGQAMTIEVLWRSGRRSEVASIHPGRLYEIEEPSTPIPPRAVPTVAAPFFTDVSDRLQHHHVEEPYNDLARQPMLPWRLSQLGPGVCWHDFDGDGWMDLAIGSGKSGRVALFHNDGKGGFTPMTNGAFARPLGRDTAGLAAWGAALIAGSANYEDGSTNGGAIRIYDTTRGAAGDSVLGPVSSTGPVALADIDGDGDLDLFLGGRVVAGRFPESAASELLKNEGGRFVRAQRLEALGLASGAVFTDLDADGDPDLVVACEWGGIRCFRNAAGRFEPWDLPLTSAPEDRGIAGMPASLSGLTGWWHGVSAGDFDGDGRMDLAASNWGLNGRYHAEPGNPWILYHGDLSGAGHTDLVEARMEAGRELPERTWRMVRSALPFLNEQISGYEAYAGLTVQEIYRERLGACRRIEVATSRTMVFLNRGDHFEARALPAEAQWSPAFGICVADLDGDGNEDLFLSQNFFPMNPETARQDGGRGLWLKGDGRGGFKAVDGAESGIQVYGDQRGCAVADFDNDGRVDLVVTQNGGATRLYRNEAGRPGLRVRAVAGPQNAAGVGAQVAIDYGDHAGPTREIHAGAGYWSQDAPTQVLGLTGTPAGVRVRWPGGTTGTYPLPAAARDVEIDRATGQLTVRP